MFLIPLGLQAKTRDFPWMSVSICVFTVIYSVMNFDAAPNYFAKIANDPATLKRVQAEKSLLASGCSSLAFLPAECAFLRRELQPERSENERQAILRLVSESRIEEGLSEASLGEVTSFLLKPARLRALEHYFGDSNDFKKFEDALTAENRMTQATAKEHSILTRMSFNFQSLIRSLVLHAGWMHLISNMIFFLLFSIPLESRVGALPLVAIYVVAGSMGMTLDLFMSTDSTKPLLGASASASAVAAAFMVSFWAQKVRVFLSVFFAFNQIVLVPTWMFFAFFVVLSDVAGAFGARSDGVAHVAHLGGFGLGALMGFMITQITMLPSAFVFPFELEMFLKSRQTKDLGARLSILHQVLFFNPQNGVAIREAWQVYKNLETLHWQKLSEEQKKFLSRHFISLLKILKSADKNSLGEFLLKSKDAEWPYKSLMATDDLVVMMNLVRELQRENRIEELGYLARIVNQAFPNSDEAEALRFFEKRLSIVTIGTIDERFGNRRTGS